MTIGEDRPTLKAFLAGQRTTLRNASGVSRRTAWRIAREQGWETTYDADRHRRRSRRSRFSCP